MRKSHRNEIKCYKEGGQIVSGNSNTPDLGRAKKLNTPAEDLYLGQANAKRMIAEKLETRKHYKHHNDENEYEPRHESKPKVHAKERYHPPKEQYAPKYTPNHESKPKVHAKERYSQQRIVISIDNEQPMCGHHES